jgi:cell division protein FtsI/penicillin-binding protein 2
VENTLADAMTQYGSENGQHHRHEPAQRRNSWAWRPGPPSIPTTTSRPADQPGQPAVSGQYEPGSTFKILTMAAALDSGTVTPQTPFVDTGSVEVGGIIINNWNGGAWGPVDMLGCMQHSLNVCLASIATWLGRPPSTTTCRRLASAT